MPPPSRTYGRVFVDPDGNIIPTNEYGLTKWVVVTPDASGNLDGIYITTLAQVLKLNLNESPFFSNYGIPAEQSVISQIAPDYYANRTQRQFAQYFASLIIYREEIVTPPNQRPVPTYRVNILTHSGTQLAFSVVPT